MGQAVVAFTPIADIEEKNRLLLNVWGPPKAGKTTLALTFPEPIYYFNFDLGLEQHIGRIAEKQMFVSQYEAPMSATFHELERLAEEVNKDMSTAGKATMHGGTIIIDTGDDLWSLYSRLALEEEAGKRGGQAPLRFSYGAANNWFKNVVDTVKRAGYGNLVIIDREKDEYDSKGKETGKKLRKGWKGVEYGTLMTMRMTARQVSGQTQHYGLIEKNGYADALNGMELENPTFDSIMGLARAMGWQG